MQGHPVVSEIKAWVAALHPVLRVSLGLSVLLVTLSAFFTISAWIGLWVPGSASWLLAMPTQFRPHYLVIQALALGTLAIGYTRVQSLKYIGPVALGILPFLVINLAWLAPYYAPGQKPFQTYAEAQKLKIFLINLGEMNDYFALIDQLQAEKPGVLAVTEHAKSLGDILNHPVWQQDYPYRAVDFNAGLGLYSKFPLSHVQLREGRNQAPFLTLDLQLTDRQISVGLGHPSVPTSPENWMRQTRQFTDWGQHPPAILMGDMNTAPWMPHFARATGKGVLRDSALGWGIQPTWAVENPIVALPIDHIFIGKAFKVLDRHIGPELGSDHRPVIVELGLQPLR